MLKTYYLILLTLINSRQEFYNYYNKRIHMTEETKALDIDLSLKKNNVDEFFFNLSENPNGFKNKDFRYTLSLIYQLIEDEFEGIEKAILCPTSLCPRDSNVAHIPSHFGIVYGVIGSSKFCILDFGFVYFTPRQALWS